VARKRRVRWFNYLAQKIYDHPHTIDAEWRWLVRQGPYTPALLDYLLKNHEDYDAFVFWTYLYFPTAAGLPLVSHKSALVPTAHDEQPLYLSLFRPLFNLPRHILFNTQAEQDLVHKVFSNQRIPSSVVGLGIDPPIFGDASAFRSRHDLKGRVLLFMGRVDVKKGCQEMFDYFIALAEKPEFKDLNLVLVGKKRMQVPDHNRILSLGFVSEQEKADALAAADALIMPSPHESLSMVTLEASLAGKPVLVTEKCEVLVRYIENSKSGLTYDSKDDLAACLTALAEEPETARGMGARGKRFVEKNYHWDRVMETYEEVLAEIAREKTV
jgi:glycosyltransferase involved in cell wall biosynthesis